MPEIAVRVLSMPDKPLLIDPALWIVVVTTIYVILTYLLLRESRKSFVELNSPYVGVAGALLKKDEEDGTKAYVEIHFTNYGKVPANDVALFARFGGKHDEVKQGSLTGILPKTTAFPGTDMFQVETMADKNASGKYHYDSIVEFKNDLFLRVELHAKYLDGKNYVHYYLGKYVHSHNNFGVLESWAGEEKKCPYPINKSNLR